MKKQTIGIIVACVLLFGGSAYLILSRQGAKSNSSETTSSETASSEATTLASTSEAASTETASESVSKSDQDLMTEAKKLVEADCPEPVYQVEKLIDEGSKRKIKLKGESQGKHFFFLIDADTMTVIKKEIH
ncbi:MAG: hypothetical protein Q4P72_02230 [Eubacteriales bacterium]|nr:hypothetical protein [Eubacteriales bacterium]